VHLFGAPSNALAQLFKMSVLAAMGARTMLGDTALSTTGDGSADITFWPNELLWLQVCPMLGSVPRIIVAISPKNEFRHESARCRVDVEMSTRPGGPGPMSLTVKFPDQILGLERLVCRDGSQTTYRGLFFNSTPGEVNSNLFDVLNSVSTGFSLQLTHHLRDVRSQTVGSLSVTS
jgi:hypothetical protein